MESASAFGASLGTYGAFEGTTAQAGVDFSMQMSLCTVKEDYLLNSWISTVIISIVCILSLMRGMQSIWHYLNYTIPQQFIQLVRQAHLGQPFQTLWNIEVDDSMRQALCAPLTESQICRIAQMKHDITRYSIDCYVITHKLRSKELTGVVSVSLNVDSQSGACDYHCSKVMLRIIIRHIGRPGVDNRWVVSSVEQL